MPSYSEIAMIMDKGIIAFLFVIVFVYFIYKGIPAIVKLAQDSLNKINAEHTHQIMMLTGTFEKTIDTITTRFINQIEQQHIEQEKYHKEHGQKIEEIYTVLKSKPTSLRPRKNAS